MAGQHDQELNLLREWREPITARRFTRAALGSLLAHAVAISALILALGNPPARNPQAAFIVDVRRAVPLYLPRELTQRDANQGRITHTLDVRSSAAPAAVPQAPRFRPPQPNPVPALPAPVVVEPPKIEADAAPPPPPLPSPGRLPQPAPPPPDKPKLAFENVGAGGAAPRTSISPASKIPDPKTAAENSQRASVQPGMGLSGIVVGDPDEITVPPSPNQPSAAGPVRSNLQLLSDPKGVDFKPYLIQVLTAVRSNWLAVIPESARLGRKGRVLVQFIIDRRGGIPKLVIAESSGAAALDRAAVAGISASNPFPPLPTTFPGDEIRLQLAFSYNQPAR
jgi:TonB family protein